MLIKRGKLHQETKPSAVSVVDFTEAARASQLEIQKAKQEARLIKQDAQNILDESQKKLKEAEAKAKQIVQDTNLEAKRIKEKVYNETLLAAKGEINDLKNEARGLLIELFEVKREALTQAHKEIIKIALDIAEKVIKYQASVDPEILKRQVVEAIKKATSEADRVQVFVNPQDLKVLEDSVLEMKKLFPGGIDIVLLSSESVDPGSCIVETKSGQLDASFSTQIKALVNLTSHLEVKEPQIEMQEEDKVLEAQSEGFLKTSPEVEEDILSEDWEEEDVEDTKDIGDVIESAKEPEAAQADYTFTEEEEKLKEELLGDEPLIQLPQEEETFPFVQEDPVLEEIQPKKKKLDLSNLLKRTEEEKEELDEDFEYEEEIPEKEVKPQNVLKPKKPELSKEVSKIAKEIEESPEWKNLLEEEE